MRWPWKRDDPLEYRGYRIKVFLDSHLDGWRTYSSYDGLGFGDERGHYSGAHAVIGDAVAETKKLIDAELDPKFAEKDAIDAWLKEQR